jgi:hypothetical protein
MDRLDDEASRSDAICVHLDELVVEASRQSFPARDVPAIHFDEGALVRPAAHGGRPWSGGKRVWRRRITDGPADRVEVGT